MAKRFVCPSCGSLAPQGLADCATCGASLKERTPRMPAAVNGRRWVRAVFRRKCPACKEAQGVGLLELRSDVVCEHCGDKSKPDAAELRDLLEMAHAAADPKGVALAELRGLGSQKTSIEYARDQLSVTIGPGFPWCTPCALPKEVDVLGRGRLALRCPKCSTKDVYEAPWAGEANADLIAWCHAQTAVQRSSAQSGGDAGEAHVWLAFRGASPRVSRTLEPPAPSSREMARSRRVRDRLRNPIWVQRVMPVVVSLGLAAVLGVLIAPLLLLVEGMAFAEQKDRASWEAATCTEVSRREVHDRRRSLTYVTARAERANGSTQEFELDPRMASPPRSLVVRAIEPMEVSGATRPCFVNGAKAAFFRAKEIATWPLALLGGIFLASLALLFVMFRRA